MNARDDLKTRLDELSDTAIRFVTRMVDSLSSPPSSHYRRSNCLDIQDS